jgi:hypothetical protein
LERLIVKRQGRRALLAYRGLCRIRVAALWTNHAIALWMRVYLHYVALAQKIKQRKDLRRNSSSPFASDF